MARLVPVYFDAAIIAKYYLNEPGREIVRRIAAEAGRVVSSSIVQAEVSAAFHRKLREQAIAANLYGALQEQFTQDVRDGLWALVPASDAVLDDVRRLFESLDRSVYLRALDALHLATARVENLNAVYSNDRHVLTACASVGLHGINPIA
jgi:predicted nucleic acid-binding protein